MTKAQREEKARNERKLQQMLAAGIKVNALEGEEPKKKPVYDDKKKRAANKKVSFAGISSGLLCYALNSANSLPCL